MRKKIDNRAFSGTLHQVPKNNIFLCRVVGIVVFALGVLMLFRYHMASASTEPLGLYNNQLQALLEKGFRIVAVVLGSSALSFILPGIFSVVTGIMVFMGRRSKVMFGVSIVMTLLCGSIGRLLDSVFHTLSCGQMRYTTCILFGGLVILVCGTVLVGREHAKVERILENRRE